MLRLVSGAIPADATIITTKPSPSSTQPIAILVRLEGSCLRFDCHAQKVVSTGVTNQIMKGLKAWYHVEGIVNPNSVGQRVFPSAHNWSVLPCCSYTAQNAATTKHETQIAITRGRSSPWSRAIHHTMVASTATASESPIILGSVSSHNRAMMPSGIPMTNEATPISGALFDWVGGGSCGSLSWLSR